MHSETITLDTFGHVLIPKHLRTALNLEPQSQFDIQIQDGSLVLSPRCDGEVIEQDGIYVWTGTDIPDSIEEMIVTARATRMDDLE